MWRGGVEGANVDGVQAGGVGGAAGYAALLHVELQWENPQYAFVQAPGCGLGFHPRDHKSPGGVGGATVYWSVDDLQVTLQRLEGLGATRYRGPMTTSLGAQEVRVHAPFGCTLGLHQTAVDQA